MPYPSALRATAPARIAPACLAVLGALALVGCQGDAKASAPVGARHTERTPAPRRIGAFAEREWESRLLAVERRIRAAEPIRPLALRAGGGLVAVLLAQPSVAYMVELTGEAAPPMMGGPNGDFTYAGTLARGYPSDVVTVAPDSRAWYLDVRSGRVMSEDVGYNHRLIATLTAHGRARSGCALDPETIAYVTDARPGVVFVHRRSEPAHDRALVLPAGYAPTRTVPWTSVRFGGSPSGPCVLWAPRMASVLLVSDRELRPLGAFVEPVPRHSWYQALRRRVRRIPEPDYVLDATSFPGGVAVLFAGHTAGAGRIVDLYSEQGAYRETMVLPSRALRIAGYDARLYVLRQRRDSVRLASYLLPAGIRSGMPAVTRAPPQDIARVRAITGRVSPRQRHAARGRADSIVRRAPAGR